MQDDPSLGMIRSHGLRRIRRAKDMNFQGHAHRYDNSLQYCTDCRANGIPRELVLHRVDDSGNPIGSSYRSEEQYLSTHSFESSEVYSLLRGGTTAATINAAVGSGLFS